MIMFKYLAIITFVSSLFFLLLLTWILVFGKYETDEEY